MKDAATLSFIELQITQLLAWGASKKQVSAKLSLSTRSVEGHTRDIYNKVGVSKASELSAWWFCTQYKIPFTDSPFFKNSNVITTNRN